ncbi:SNARE associated protein [Thermoanaerobacter ethanolicus JW 200]|uniref:Putative membrane-associated protein n=1 Tax=Thermoanaerobacter siderophilus SR4 TaxID=880478 RepID=I9KRS7_9THEO|nr:MULTISPECIES: VTT domain-containing protein [Thermoanaerobacter]EGD51459.1 SNARE associated protein [Thermoanaerobacter ethanolicus JW 200]EIV99490.1 putative membrane-associated protein [Thermoanaerobacter siderophilus SR4]
MDLIKNFIDIVLHLDKYLGSVIQTYGTYTYSILFFIIFLETGFVVTPFLPGDSLLFAAGTFAAIGSLNIFYVVILLAFAAILGDTINYHIGKFVGGKIYERENLRLIKREHLLEARDFYEKYGSITIVVGRFIPIIRTFVPFVAGIGQMRYFKFLFYNALGGTLWVLLFTLGGYYFGNLQIVRDHFGLVTIAIIVISLIPAIISFLKRKKR